MKDRESSSHETVRSPDSHTGGGTSSRDLFDAGEATLDRALVLVEYLRAHCPWDRKQTARSLVPHLLEEVHETVDAIHADDPDSLRGELGDLLLNLAFQIVVAEESGAFDRDQVLRTLEGKMIRRHPHLFGSGKTESWEAIKARERTVAGEQDGVAGVLDGVPGGIDALLRAHRIQDKVAGVGFDWDESSGALAKVREELAEFEEALEAENTDEAGEELGDLLFAVVNLVRLSGFHAVTALELANAKFQRRFRALEALARARGLPMPGTSLDELDELWNEVKGQERSG